MNKLPNLDVVFLDTGLYSSEGFTSGLLIFLKNMLNKFSEHNLKVGILSCIDKSKVKPKTESCGLRIRSDSGIEVFEIIVDERVLCSPLDILNNYKALLEQVKPHTIIMSTPSVFLEEKDVKIREIANQYGSQVIHVLADELFPTKKTHDLDLVEQLYKALGQGEVIGVTERIREQFRRASGIESTPFKTVINTSSILAENHELEYIGMVNIHPLKGISIFNQVAANMPQYKFMVVKNWPDVPEYKPSSKNVKVVDFLENTAFFYKKIKVLLIPSLLQEGPTMVIMEALYNGIPVIANRIGSIPEAGEDAATYIIPPEITGYNMQGTVLYPEYTQESFERTVSDYCSSIEHVISRYSSHEACRLKEIAIKDIRNGHETIDRLVNKWCLKISS